MGSQRWLGGSFIVPCLDSACLSILIAILISVDLVQSVMPLHQEICRSQSQWKQLSSAKLLTGDSVRVVPGQWVFVQECVASGAACDLIDAAKYNTSCVTRETTTLALVWPPGVSEREETQEFDRIQIPSGCYCVQNLHWSPGTEEETAEPAIPSSFLRSFFKRKRGLHH